MKICPTCRKTYMDDGLSFCLDDGSMLNFASTDAPETLVMPAPRPTDPSPFKPSTPMAGAGWSKEPAYTMQPPKKSSKAWMWVVGILGLVVVLCGGGFAALVGIGLMTGGNTDPGSNSEIVTGNKSTNLKPANSPGPSDNNSIQEIDLSEWVKEFSVWGTTEFTNGEFLMAAKQKGYYYVLVAPDEYNTGNATTKVTARNVDAANTSLGFGLIVHSDPTPLTKDYAFLIDSIKKRFRIVRHEPDKEKVITPWTNSALIKEGGALNDLEVRDKGSSLEFYINGQLATSVKNTDGPTRGVPGLYSGDAVKVGFKKLQISK
jgi:hypothetical protein